MRILIAVGSMHPTQGGPPVVVVGHAAALADRGHDVTIVTTSLPGQAEETVDAWQQLKKDNIKLLQFDRDRPAALGASKSLNKFLAESQNAFDVAHLHGVWEQCLASVGKYARQNSIPYVIAPHGMLDHYSMARSRAKKWIARYLFGTQAMLKNAAAAQFGTEDERDEAASLKHPWKPFIIRNGVPEEIFSQPKTDLDLNALFPQLADADPLFVFYSRMHYKKGIDILLESIAKTVVEFPRARYLIAALAQDQQYENTIRERASKDDLKNSVVVTTELTGSRGAGILQLADVFVLPSRQEGFSMAILEAMANKLPLLISDMCHMQFVTDIKAGLVSDISVDNFSAALRQVLEMNDDDRKQLGENGRQWIQQNCTWKSIARQLEEMYVSLIETAR